MSNTIQAQLVKVNQHPSKFGGVFYYLFFKDLSTGNNYKSCVSPSYRNWSNWQKIVENFSEDKPLYLENLLLKNGLIDADSKPRIVEEDRTNE